MIDPSDDTFDLVHGPIDDELYFPYLSELIDRSKSLLRRKSRAEIATAAQLMGYFFEMFQVEYDHQVALQCETASDADLYESSDELGEFVILKEVLSRRFKGRINAAFAFPDFAFEKKDLSWYRYEVGAVVALQTLTTAMLCCDANRNVDHWVLELKKLGGDVDVLESEEFRVRFPEINRRQAWRLSLIALRIVLYSEELRLKHVQELLSLRAHSRKAKNLNKAKHRDTYIVREKVLVEWEKKVDAFPSATKAGYHFYTWLLEQGLKQHEPSTITKWIRDAAKEKGIKWRA
jgi:hypothetical protein